MRGRSDENSPLFQVFDLEEWIRADHPLRDIKRRVDRILTTRWVPLAIASAANQRR